MATGPAAVAGLGPYLRTTRQDSTIPVSTTLWPEKRATLFDEFPVQAALLRRCHAAGYSEGAIKVAVLTSAGLAPGLRKQWDDFFAKAATRMKTAAVTGIPAPISKPVAGPAAPPLPKPAGLPAPLPKPTGAAALPMPNAGQLAATKARLGQAQQAQDTSTANAAYGRRYYG